MGPLVLRHQVLEHLQAALGQGVGDALGELGQPPVVDRVDAGQLHLLDVLPGGPLDGPQQVPLARRDEQDRLPAAPGPAGAADAVHVGLGVVRDVVIEHVRDALDVEPAGGDVGGHQDVDLAVPEVADGAFPLRLRDVAVDRRRAEAAGLQLLREFFRELLGANEHDHRVERLDLKDSGQRVELVRGAHRHVPLVDVGRGAGLGLDRDLDRLVEIVLADLADRAGHGRREQRDLSTGRHGLQDLLDVLDEAHPQHLVGLVEHQVLEPGQVERALLQVVDQPAGGADDDVRAATQAAELRAVAGAAVDGQHVEAGNMRGVTLEGLGNLDGQLAGGREHQGLRAGGVQVEAGQDGQRERGGLSGAGLGQAQHVAALQQQRDGLFLDRRRGLVADLAERLADAGVEIKFVEGRHANRGSPRWARQGADGLRKRPGTTARRSGVIGEASARKL